MSKTISLSLSCYFSLPQTHSKNGKHFQAVKRRRQRSLSATLWLTILDSNLASALAEKKKELMEKISWKELQSGGKTGSKNKRQKKDTGVWKERV